MNRQPAPRKCRYCKATFQPQREHARFCCEDHRVEYWRYGKLPFQKMLARVEQEARRVAREEAQRVIAESTAQKTPATPPGQRASSLPPAA